MYLQHVYVMAPKAAESVNNTKLENVSTANALQLEAARRRTVPIRFYTSPVASLKSLTLSVAVFAAYTLRYAVTLNFDPVTLTFDL